ncbi:MAG: magnesium transporter [Gammaproteobacteria bacterium]
MYETLQPAIEDLIQQQRFAEIRRRLQSLEPGEISILLEMLSREDGVIVFRSLPRQTAAEVFEHLRHDSQIALVENMFLDSGRLGSLLNDLSPDDRTAFLAPLPEEVVQRLLALLDPKERTDAVRLLGFPEDSVGRLATTDYIALRPEWTVEQALQQIRRIGRTSETINVLYIVDRDWKLLDDVKVRDLLLAEPDADILSLMDHRFVSLAASDDQEKAVAIFKESDRSTLPVVDADGVLVGIVTVDDVLDVAEEEATEDIQKLGGLEALDSPYLDTPLPTLVKKRARWLAVLFVGEMFTATAMGYYETELARAVVLALFVPLVISSGGNSGSQAASLMIRALAIGEVRLKDWWRVMSREVVSGLALGAILGVMGFLRVIVWARTFDMYGEHWMLLGITVGLALVGVVMWGTLAGSMLPFIMKRLGADPATSSAPFVATLVDVTGLIIYFSVAVSVLSGSLL